MSYHDKIMNIQAPAVTYPGDLALAYKTGHRDARHAAAEIAVKADAEIERLREALSLMTSHYCNLVRSGDAGTWEPDAEPEVQIARAALERKP